MDINKLINDFKEFDSATVQNAMILVRGYVDANIDYTSPDLKCYNFQNPVVGIAVTAKVTPLDEPKSKIDFPRLVLQGELDLEKIGLSTSVGSFDQGGGGP